MFQIVLIAVFGIGAILLAIFVVKSVRSPKKIGTINVLLQQGKVSQAIKIAKAIISKDNKDIQAHYYLGKAYLQDNKDELALMEFKIVNQEAIFDVMNIPEREYRHLAGKLYNKFNQPDAALNEYILLSKLEPTNAEVFFEAAKLFEAKKKNDHAIGYYNKTIQLNKRHAKAHAARGLLLFRAKKYAEARKAIEHAIQLSPDSYFGHYYLGKILKESRDYPAAVAEFEKATRDPDFRQKALIERGTCFMAANNFEKAKPEFERVISLSKNEETNESLYARYFLASCFEKSRDIEKAIVQWNLIMKKNKNFRDVPAKLAEYKTFNDNDSIKEYLTCSDDEFIKMCKSIISKNFGHSAQNTTPTKTGCELIATEEKDSNWREVRKKLAFFVFYRETNVIEDSVIRNLLEKAKSQKCASTYILTSSDYSRSAMTFAETRPIELFNSEKLQGFLDNIGV